MTDSVRTYRSLFFRLPLSLRSDMYAPIKFDSITPLPQGTAPGSLNLTRPNSVPRTTGERLIATASQLEFAAGDRKQRAAQFLIATRNACRDSQKWPARFWVAKRENPASIAICGDGGGARRWDDPRTIGGEHARGREGFSLARARRHAAAIALSRRLVAIILKVDDRLVEEARRLGHHRTKKETVTAALEGYIEHRVQHIHP